MPSETYPDRKTEGGSGHLIRSAHARSATSDSELASAWSILDVPEARAVPAWRCWRMIAGRRLGALVDAHGMWHRDVMRASCRRTPEHPPSPAPPGHAAPDPACTCGINGYAERAEAIVTLALLG